MTETKKQNPLPTLTELSNKLKVWRSDELFSGGREVLIEHQQSYYRLLITKTGKLILNK